MYDEKVINEIRDYLLKRHQTISVAESVTAGHLQAALASAENAAKFFQGGITAYNLGQKARHLHIEPIHAEQCNCVSEQIATQMAAEVSQLFTSDWGIAITGYAAPVPELSIHKLFAYYAISFRKKIVEAKEIEATTEDPIEVQVFYVNNLLKNLLSHLRDPKYQSSFSSSDLNSINSKFASAGPLSTSPSIEERAP
jgi:PncC family amidohydrolase